MRTIRALRTIAAGHAFGQNLRHGHYELTAQMSVRDRLRVGFSELATSL
jgi:cell division protein YceG involved in septum cleavage